MAGLEDIEKLGLLVRADEKAGDPQTWVMTYTGHNDIVLIGCRGWPEDVRPLLEHEIDDLADRGWVRVLKRDGKARTYAVTAAGRSAWRIWERQHAASAGQVDLSWPTARALLVRIQHSYENGGASDLGLDIRTFGDDAQTHALVRELRRGGYVEDGEASNDIDTFIRPTTHSLQLFNGWPGGRAQDVLDGFINDLETAITAEPDEERRSKLRAIRDGLLGAGRDVALAFLEKKVLGL